MRKLCFQVLIFDLDPKNKERARKEEQVILIIVIDINAFLFYLFIGRLAITSKDNVNTNKGFLSWHHLLSVE